MNRKAWHWGAGAWVALRLISAGAAVYAEASMVGGGIDVPGYRPPELAGPVGALAGPWLRADALWYLRVATEGYAPDGTLAFFPALPAATALLRPVMGNEAIAALVVSNLAALLGLVLLYALLARLLDDRAARAGVVGFALFPTAFFLVAPYGESLLLLAGAGALLAVASRRPVLGMVSGAAAALSRPFGFLLALPMAAVAARQKDSAARWLAPLGPLAGLAAWIVYAWRLTGEPLAAVRVQSSWRREPTPVWETLRLAFEQLQQYASQPFGGYLAFDLAATLLGLVLIPVAAWLLWRRGKAAWAVGLGLYGAAVLAVPLLLPFRPRALMSNPRFLLAMFPLFLAYALIPSRLRIPLALISGAGMAVGTTVYIAGRPLF